MKIFLTKTLLAISVLVLAVSCSKDDPLADGEEFLKENAKKEGVVVTSSGLQYNIIKRTEDHRRPTQYSRVKCNYEGKLVDGTVFDSANDATFSVSSVIRGWQEALPMMKVGEIWMLYIPYYLGYGTSAQGDIPAYSALIFRVELVDIVKQ